VCASEVHVLRLLAGQKRLGGATETDAEATEPVAKRPHAEDVNSLSMASQPVATAASPADAIDAVNTSSAGVPQPGGDAAAFWQELGGTEANGDAADKVRPGSAGSQVA
jgi:hypothetical protein